MLRLASQVSWAASLSRLRGVAAIVMAKPFWNCRAICAFQPAEMIDIGDDAFADVAADRRDQRHAAGRHIDDLAGKFAAVGQHVAAEQIDADALMAPALLGMRQVCDFGLRQRHAAATLALKFAARPIHAPLTAALAASIAG